MKIQVLFASMYQKDDSLPLRSKVIGDYLVVNQTDYSKYPNIINTDKTKFFISTEERGLSNSRNSALKYATGDVCLIADDDLEYLDGYEEIVRNAYGKYPDADVILFDFLEEDSIRKRKPIAKLGGRLNYVQILRGNSVRICFRLKSIKDNNIIFNKFFGAGSGYFTAFEDIVFLTECLRKKLKIYYEPINILQLKNTNESSWFNGFDKQYFNNIGAFSYFYLGKFWWLYSIQYLVRHLSQLEMGNMNILRAFNEIKKGVKRYKECIKK